MFTNHLLQSSALVLVAAAFAYLLRRQPASVRYWIWMAASLKFLVPFALLVSAGRQVPAPAIPVAAIAASPAAVALDTAFLPVLSNRSEPQWQTALIYIWILGALAVVSIWIWRFRRVRNNPAVEPGVFGVFRPRLILPEGIADRLSPEQLRAVIAHETTHIRRRDNLFAAIHMLVEALFWFHPLVWWIGARLIDERERACDEEVLRQGTDPHAYASGILEVCKFYLESPLACVSGVTGADLKRRIASIMTARVANRLTFVHKTLLAAACVVVISLPLLIGVVHAQQDVFEVASVKPAPPGIMGVRIQFTPSGGVRIENGPLLNIIMMAYDMERFQISGAPEWIYSAQYSIEGKGGAVGGADEHEVARRRLRNLLAERFQLKVRPDSKETPVYNLVVARSGHKLKESDSGAEGVNGSRPGQLHSDKVAMPWLARVLSMMVGRPVFDKTGLTGTYAFDLNWTPDLTLGDAKGGIARMKQEQALEANPPDPNGPSIFTAVQDQLGLRLESTKAPVESIVIEHVERPTAN